MATSGSYNYSLTAAQLCTAAAEDLGVLAAGESLTTNDQTMMLRRLNMLAKQWQGGADGMPGVKVHTRQRITLFVAKGQQTYVIGPGSSDARATTQYGRTTIDVAEAASQTTLSVAATTDTTTVPGTTITMTAADIIGIEMDDGTIHWSTISSLSAGDTVTIADATPDTAAVGNYVWWFTSRAQRFPLLEAAVLRDENYKDTPLTIYQTVREYDLGITDKYADSTPTGLLFEPLRTQTRITLNSQPTDVTKTIVLTALYPAEDYDATTDDIAFPQEAFAALSWELALRCAPAFGVTWNTAMEKSYQSAINRYITLNPENSVLYFLRDG